MKTQELLNAQNCSHVHNCKLMCIVASLYAKLQASFITRLFLHIYIEETHALLYTFEIYISCIHC